jgi:hypothetical protein
MIKNVERLIRERAFGLAVKPLKVVKASFVSHTIVIGAATIAREWMKENRR